VATYVYNISDGSLFAWGLSDRVGDVCIRPTLFFNYGLAFKSNLLPLDRIHIWDPITISVIVIVNPIVNTVMSDIPVSVTANGFVLTLPSPDLAINYTMTWGQGQVAAFFNFSQSKGSWDKAAHSKLWQWLQSKSLN